MVRVRQSEFEHSVLVKFDALHRALTSIFGEIVDHVLADAMHGDSDDTTLDQRQSDHPA